MRSVPRFESWLVLAASVTLSVVAMSCRGDDGREQLTVHFIQQLAHAEKEFDAVAFQSFRKDGRLSAQMTIGGETRECLTPPLPSRLTFEATIPEKAKLQFSIGVFAYDLPSLPSRILFRVHLDDGQGERTIFEDVVRHEELNQWRDEEIDLGSLSGRTTLITFETTPLRRHIDLERLGAVIPMWGHPVLFPTEQAPPHPSIFLISIDCLRGDHVGTYGYERQTTPNIDRFAGDGVVFETALASAPETMPSHMSVFTGLVPSFHGARRWRRLSTAIPYLPEILAAHEYDVSAVVTGAFLSQAFGFERGFHTYRFFDDPRAGTAVDSALELIRRNKDRSQFVLLHLFDPHWPYVPPSELIGHFGPRPADISELLDRIADQNQPPRNDDEVQQVIDLYDAEILSTDFELGRFFRELQSMGLYDSSLIILFGDHGEAFYEHDLWQHAVTVYEEMIGIPLIVKWPGKSPKGRSPVPAHQVDILPTILESVGAQAPFHQGTSLRRLLAHTTEPSRILISEAGWMSSGRAFMKLAFRDEATKYVAHFEDDVSQSWPPGTRVAEELFDLARDPPELQNVAREREGQRETFRSRLQSFLDEAARRRPRQSGAPVILDEATRKRLEALGYMERQ